MKNKLVTSLLFTALLAVSGCSNPSSKEAFDPNDDGFRVKEAPTATVEDNSWTIFIYMCGSNLESTYGYELATADITEILNVTGQPEDVNIVIETGGAYRWSSKYGIKSNKLSRYHIRDGELVKDIELNNASMGKQSTLQDFLTWGLATYPADKTGLVLWNHGGALSGVCFDENYNEDSLNDVELISAVDGAMKANNITSKLEWIGYDACLMALQDIAEMNSSCFNYMVASEESEVGEGWYYEGWVDALYQKYNTEYILSRMCDTFIEECDQILISSGYSVANNDQGLAVYDLNKISNYKDKVEKFSSDCASLINEQFPIFKRDVLLKSKMYASTEVSDYEYDIYVNYYGYSASMFAGPYNMSHSYTYYILLGCYLYGTFDAVSVFRNMFNHNMFKKHKALVRDVLVALSDVIVYCATGKGAGETYGMGLAANVDRTVNYAGYSKNYTHFDNWRSLFFK